MRRVMWIVLILAVLVGLAHAVWPGPPDRGSGAFFADRTYDFEAKRVLNDVAPAGGDTNEALHAIRHVTAGDEEGWFAAWKQAGDRALALASRTGHVSDPGARWATENGQWVFGVQGPFAVCLWQGTLFDWLAETYPTDSSSAGS
jgi:hypothetical protein